MSTVEIFLNGTWDYFENGSFTPLDLSFYVLAPVSDTDQPSVQFRDGSAFLYGKGLAYLFASGSVWDFGAGTALIITSPYGAFNDFAIFDSTHTDPLDGLVIAATDGALTGGVGNAWTRHYRVLLPPKNARFAVPHIKLGSVAAGNAQYLDGHQFEALNVANSAPSAFDQARSIQVFVKPTRLNYALGSPEPILGSSNTWAPQATGLLPGNTYTASADVGGTEESYQFTATARSQTLSFPNTGLFTPISAWSAQSITVPASGAAQHIQSPTRVQVNPSERFQVTLTYTQTAGDAAGRWSPTFRIHLYDSATAAQNYDGIHHTFVDFTNETNTQGAAGINQQQTWVGYVTPSSGTVSFPGWRQSKTINFVPQWMSLDVYAGERVDTVGSRTYTFQTVSVDHVPENILVEEGTTLGAPFNGNSGDDYLWETSGYKFAWTGTPGNSTSTMTDPDGNVTTNLIPNPNFEYGLTGWTANNSTVGTSTTWSESGTNSIQITPNVASPDDSYVAIGGNGNMLGMVPGGTYTLSATMRLPVAQTGSGVGKSGQSRNLLVAYFQPNGQVSAVGQNGPGPNVSLVQGRQYYTFTVPSNAQGMQIRLYNGAATGEGDVQWDDVMLVAGTADPVFGYFDGDTQEIPGHRRSYYYPDRTNRHYVLVRNLEANAPLGTTVETPIYATLPAPSSSA